MNNPPCSLKILVVDDTQLSRYVVCEYLQTLGHQPIEAVDGNDALERFLECVPDIVLMDLMMPAMNGIEATRVIRTLPGASWVPIILLSAFGSNAEFIAALDAGCDDCMTKPVNFPLLEAKINALRRIAEMQHEMDRRGRELQKFYSHVQDELSLTEHIMARLVRREAQPAPQFSEWIEAAFGASGDIIVTTHADNGIRYAMLADATGHGLAAAVTLIPVTNVFYAMTAKGFGVTTIVEEMNRQVRSYCPTERFVALTLIAIDTQSHVIEVWNGGNPPLLALDEQGNELRRFHSHHLPLGILGAKKFSSETEFLQYKTPLQLALFSDGLIEAGSAQLFSLERVVTILSTYPAAQRMEALQQAFRNFIGEETAHDDISVALLDCPLSERAPRMAAGSNAQPVSDNIQSDWKLESLLSAAQLKTIDVVPMVVEWAHAMGLPKETNSNFFLVVTELFLNALEHGLLELPSGLKDSARGFEHYIEQRNLRLQNLNRGQIQVTLSYESSSEGNIVRIYIKDSGNGFDYQWIAAAAPVDKKALSGRGIMLVRHLCRSLEYFGKGNEVCAELLLNEAQTHHLDKTA